MRAERVGEDGVWQPIKNCKKGLTKNRRIDIISFNDGRLAVPPKREGRLAAARRFFNDKASLAAKPCKERLQQSEYARECMRGCS